MDVTVITVILALPCSKSSITECVVTSKKFLPTAKTNVKRRNRDSTEKFFSKNKDKREICATLLLSME